MYSAQVIAHSVAENGEELITMKVTFPRIVLAEFNTHRAFSRNSASSRAIPFKKMLEMVKEEPFVPFVWQKDHKGMQGSEYVKDGVDKWVLRSSWKKAKEKAIEMAQFINEQGGVTKQLANRLLEPFMWHTVILTTSVSGLLNFFELRCPEYVIKYGGGYERSFRTRRDVLDAMSTAERAVLAGWTLEQWMEINESMADVHIQLLAEHMLMAYQESEPQLLKYGDWHIPYGDKIDEAKLSQALMDIGSSMSLEEAKRWVATARCARISYQTLGDNPKVDYIADIRLANKLLDDKHMSPFEHVARNMKTHSSYYNLTGFASMRYQLEYNK